MVAGLLGSTNAIAGWLIPLAIALFAGTGFGVLLGQYARRLAPRSSSALPTSRCGGP